MAAARRGGRNAATVVRSGRCSCFLRDRGRPAATAVTSSPEPLRVRGFFVPGLPRATSDGDDGALRPTGNRGEMAAGLGRREVVPRPEPRSRRAGGRRAQQVLRRRDAAVSLRRPPHGAHAELHDRRRDHAHATAPGDAGAAADGLRRVRPAGGERGDQGRRASAHRHRAQHRLDPRADAPDGLGDRLEPRDLDGRPDVLPLDAVAVPALLREGPRVPQGGARSSGARTTRPCSPTSRSSTAAASGAAPRSRRRS